MAKLDRTIPDILKQDSHVDVESVLIGMISSLPEEEELDIPAIMALKNEVSFAFSKLHEALGTFTNVVHAGAMQRYDNARAELARVNTKYAESYSNEKRIEMGIPTDENSVENLDNWVKERVK